MTINKEECKHIIPPIVKFGITKDGISSNLHTSVRYFPRYLWCIKFFDPLMIQGAEQIAFLIEQYLKFNPSRLLVWANLSTLKLESGRGGILLENDYTETQQWLQTDSWIREVWKIISTNHISIYQLITEVSTQRTDDACIMSHLALQGNFTTSELPAINRCGMSKGIFFISNIRNHQVTHLKQSEIDTVTGFNMIHDFNYPRKHHTTIA